MIGRRAATLGCHACPSGAAASRFRCSYNSLNDLPDPRTIKTALVAVGKQGLLSDRSSLTKFLCYAAILCRYGTNLGGADADISGAFLLHNSYHHCIR